MYRTFALASATRGALLVLALGAVGVAAATQGCEAIVADDVPAYTCTMTPYTNPGKGACPAGQYCKGSGCAACEDRDVCDGYDNDCDGTIDDGPYSDHDGDGFTFCGQVDGTSGKLVNLDCDDNDATIHPGAKEVCNGKDDDCNGIVDDPGVACAATMTCVPKTGQCIDNAQACTPANCPPPNVCDTSTQKCVLPDQDAGSSCSGDKACASGICGDTTELGPGQGPVCTEPCCTSADCDPGYVCYGAGTGGNYCITGTSVQRATLGTGVPGATCAGAGDCRSGVCSGSRCEDTCCGDGNCTNGTVCAVATFANHGTMACVPPSGSTTTNQDCTVDSDCSSGFCAGYTDGINDYHKCASPCCGSRQCGTFSVPGAFGGHVTIQLVCYDDTTSRNNGTIPVCSNPKQGTGNGNVGDPCSSNGDCFSDRCTNKLCTDVCCTDADCGRAGWVCRPTAVSGGTYLRCVPSTQ
jgi:hypothetical protein